MKKKINKNKKWNLLVKDKFFCLIHFSNNLKKVDIY